MYHAILSEADVIEVFPDEQTRNEVLCYYYDIEFECNKLDVDVSHRGELEEWVEKEYEGVKLEFTNPRITRLQIENHKLRQRVDEVGTLFKGSNMDYSQYNLESLLSQLETAYYEAKRCYQRHLESPDNMIWDNYLAAQAQRQAIKDEIIKRFSANPFSSL
jgi:hypothetical protein